MGQLHRAIRLAADVGIDGKSAKRQKFGSIKSTIKKGKAENSASPFLYAIDLSEDEIAVIQSSSQIACQFDSKR
jgi:hypothetical protein